jgi:hypothetical protein
MNIFVAILSYNAHSSSFCPFLCFYCFFSFPCSSLSAPKSPTAAKRRPHCQHVPPTPDIPVVKVRLVPEANRHDVKKVRKISQSNLLLFLFFAPHTLLVRIRCFGVLSCDHKFVVMHHASRCRKQLVSPLRAIKRRAIQRRRTHGITRLLDCNRSCNKRTREKEKVNILTGSSLEKTKKKKKVSRFFRTLSCAVVRR